MYTSTNTKSGSTTSITTLDIFLPNSPYITQYDLDNTAKDIHTDIKYFNNNITTMLTKLLDTNDKQD